MVAMIVRRPLTVLVTLGALLVSPWALAQGRDSYKRGVDAVEAGDFATAVEALRAAIGENTAEKVGTIRRPYLPHYYLGIALAGRGDCRGAITPWKESERQGEIQKGRRGEHADLVQRKQACEGEIRDLDNAVATAEQAIGSARKAASELAALQQTELQAEWNSGSPSLASRQSAAVARLEEAAGYLSEGRQQDSLARLQKARVVANETAVELDEIMGDARDLLGNLTAAAADAAEGYDSAEARARRQLEAVSGLAPYPSIVSRRVASLQSKLQDFASRKSSADADELQEMAKELNRLRIALRDSAAGPPAILITAAEAFLAGEYEGVIETLSDLTPQNERVMRHVCLLRAASLFALWTYGGSMEDSRESLDAVLQDCASLEPQPSAPERFFSPRFVAFYEAALRAEADDTTTEEGDASP